MKKCIKNYCLNPTKKELDSLYKYSNKYNKLKNLFYTMYQNKPDLIFLPYKFELRDRIVFLYKSKQLPIEQYTILSQVPTKTQKCALQDAISDLKAIQTTRKNKVKYKIIFSTIKTKREKEYLLYILKSNNLLNCILKNKIFIIDKFNDVDKKNLNRYLKRLLRKNTITKPFAHNNTFILEGSTQVSYVHKDNHLYISIPTLIKRKKILLKLSNQMGILKGDIRVVLNKNKRIEFHKAINIKGIYGNNIPNKTIYLSVNLIDLFTILHNNNIIEYTNNFYENVLKYQRKPTDRNQETLKNIINRELNFLIKSQKPDTVILKNIDHNFFTYTHNVINKKTFTKIKRYIKDRLVYKMNYYSINLISANSAYTDKICHQCLSLKTDIDDNNDLKCKKCMSSVSVIANSLYNVQEMYMLNIDKNTPWSMAKKQLLERKNIL